ncbi:MAG: hypothetical protein ACREJO_02170 [Phycisphaerales bacterium]
MIAERQARWGGTGPSVWSEVAAGLAIIVVLVSPVLLWSGFAARVVRRWWMTGVLTAITTLLIFPAAVLVLEAPQRRPFLSKILDPDESALRLLASLGLVSFLLGTLVHGACRWLLIRPQPDPIARCWKCEYSRQGLDDQAFCPECASARVAPMSRCGRLAASRWFSKSVAVGVLFVSVGMCATAGWKYWHNTRPILATLRSFGSPELVMATSVSINEVFAGPAAMRNLPDGRFVVLLVPDPRATASVGYGAPDCAAQLFVGVGTDNGWIKPAWIGAQSNTGYAVLNSSQLARLAVGVPQGLIDEIAVPTQPDATKVMHVQGLVRIDVRPWLGD